MITQSVLADFRSALRGSVLSPGDDGYEAALQIFNAMIDHRPALIARCVGAADVVACVEFARAYGLPSRRAAAATTCPASPSSTADS